MKNKLCFHRYKYFGYYSEGLKGEYFILVCRCQKCGKEKTKSVRLK